MTKIIPNWMLNEIIQNWTTKLDIILYNLYNKFILAGALENLYEVIYRRPSQLILKVICTCLVGSGL